MDLCKMGNKSNNYKLIESDNAIFVIDYPDNCEQEQRVVYNAKVYNLSDAIVSSGYPMQTDIPQYWRDITENDDMFGKRVNTASNLAHTNSGEGHDNFLKGIPVSFDLWFTNKAWVEAERYNWLDFISSTSTMHRISKMDIDEMCNEYVWHTTKDQLKTNIEMYKLFVEQGRHEEAKNKYLEILYNVPSGIIIPAAMITNYQQLKTIYKQRKNHKLPEWRDFCRWIELLPMSHLITGKEN